MVGVVLEEHEAAYLAGVEGLDALARAGRPGDEHASELRQEFPQDPVTMGHFFAQLTTPAWIRPLRRQGFFARPPAQTAGGESPGWLPDWPALRYLVRVARQDPALATEVAADVPATGNQLVTAGLVDLALEVPAACGGALLPRITRDLAGAHGGPREAAGAERFGALAVHLADGGRPDAALGLARVLWGFASGESEGAAEARSGGEGVARRGAEGEGRRGAEGVAVAGVVPGAAGGLRPRIGTSDYAESLRTCLPPLVAAGGPSVLEAMADLLDDAITAAAGPAMLESRQDMSVCWRPVLAGWPPGTGVEARTGLVSAVCDAPEQLRSE